MEMSIDRPGQDFFDTDLDQADPALCAAACQRDPHCKAWTFVKPGVQGEKARCWLKNAVPPPNPDDCCISGLKRPSAGSASGIERNTNRPGGDFRDFDLAKADPAACKAACDRDEQCSSWTYVKPGHQGPKARCWLKDSVIDPVPDECCDSGVKESR